MSNKLDIGSIENTKKTSQQKSSVHKILPGPKDKSKRSVFCIRGCGWQYEIVGEDGKSRCPICNKVITRESTYESVAKRFSEFIEMNQNTFDHYMFDPTKKMDKLRIPILFGREFIWVDLRFLIEFSNVASTDHSQLESFFGHLKSKCDITKM